jgi:AraC family transcriptional regulator of adaptative response/methylated-DNA-[protein]-cysteine methyltransferase
MIAIADEELLYLLEFVDGVGVEKEIKTLQIRMGSEIVPGKTVPLLKIRGELDSYFRGELKVFETPISVVGSLFQKEVWSELQRIPMGKTCSYKDIAKAIKRPLAVRAVGTANGSNQLSIIIPCHRVINASGSLGGYGGGRARKKWLLTHERSVLIREPIL